MSDSLEDEEYGLRWGVSRSIRYHERREAFFESADAIVNVLNLLSGSAAVVGLLRAWSGTFLLVPAALVAFISFINLTMRSSQMASLHAGLKQRFVDLLRQIIESPSINADHLRHFKAARLAIEKDEPTIYRVVDCLAYNEMLCAEGYSLAENDDCKYFIEIPAYMRLSANLIRWDTSRLSCPVRKSARPA